MHGANRQHPCRRLPEAAACMMVLLALLTGCRGTATPPVGDIARGRAVIDRMACGSCHRIAGIEGADGMVGPPLSHFGSQTMIAGVLPNSAANLRRYLQSPQSAVKGNVMPDQHLGDAEARDVAAYLLTLR